MVTTRHYFASTEGINWDVAHILEHLLIMGARRYLKSKDVNLDLMGWISGETFEGQMFIDAGFYGAKSAEYFDEYIMSKSSFDISEVEYAMGVIESEEKSNFVCSAEDVGSMLANIQLRWNDIYTLGVEGRVDSKSLLKPSQDEYADMQIEVMGYGLSEKEQKVFLRMRPVLSDIIENYLHNLPQVHVDYTSPVIDSGGGLQFSVFITSRVGVNISNHLDGLNRLISDYSVSESWGDFSVFFQAFADESLWSDMPTEYYRHSGIITTNQEIADLATAARVRAVFKKVQTSLRHI